MCSCSKQWRKCFKITTVTWVLLTTKMDRVHVQLLIYLGILWLFLHRFEEKFGFFSKINQLQLQNSLEWRVLSKLLPNCIVMIEKYYFVLLSIHIWPLYQLTSIFIKKYIIIYILINFFKKISSKKKKIS